MNKRHDDYQTLATAVNTFLYSLRYTENFKPDTNHDGGILAPTDGASMESIQKKLKEDLKADIVTITFEPKTKLHVDRLRITLAKDYSDDAFEEMIQKVNSKSLKEFRAKYTKPVIDSLDPAVNVFDGLVSREMAQILIGELQTYLLKKVEELDVVKKDLPNRPIHRHGWRARTEQEFLPKTANGAYRA